MLALVSSDDLEIYRVDNVKLKGRLIKSLLDKYRDGTFIFINFQTSEVVLYDGSGSGDVVKVTDTSEVNLIVDVYKSVVKQYSGIVDGSYKSFESEYDALGTLSRGYTAIVERFIESRAESISDDKLLSWCKRKILTQFNMYKEIECKKLIWRIRHLIKYNYCKMFLSETLIPYNKGWREIFSRITGVKLPDTLLDTRRLIEDLSFEDIKQSSDNYDDYNSEVSDGKELTVWCELHGWFTTIVNDVEVCGNHYYMSNVLGLWILVDTSSNKQILWAESDIELLNQAKVKFGNESACTIDK